MNEIFKKITKENYISKFINYSFKDLGIIESQKDSRCISIFFEPKKCYGYINDLNGNYYKFLPKKLTVEDAISKIFEIASKNVMITNYKSKKECKTKISKLKDMNWKTVFDNMESINITFMHF